MYNKQKTMRGESSGMDCKQVLWISFGKDIDLLRMGDTGGKGDELCLLIKQRVEMHIFVALNINLDTYEKALV